MTNEETIEYIENAMSILKARQGNGTYGTKKISVHWEKGKRNDT